MKLSLSAVSLALALGTVAISGCAKKDDKVADEMNAAMEETKEAAQATGDAMGAAVDNTGHAIGEAAGATVQAGENAAAAVKDAGGAVIDTTKDAASSVKAAGEEFKQDVKTGYEEGKQN